MGDLSEDGDQFFDTREEISSVSDSASEAGEKSDLESRVGVESVSTFGYEVWVKSPETILERRRRLLAVIGLSADQIHGEEDNGGSKSDEIDRARVSEDSGASLRSSYHVKHSSDWSSVSRCSVDSMELFCNEVDEDLIRRIKNLDDGTEFIVDEMGHDGFLSKLREVGSNKLVTGEEFERIIGFSPFIQQVMRKDTRQMPDSSVMDKQVRKGWLKRLGLMACVADVQAASSGNDADCCRSSPISSVRAQAAKVRSTRKHAKELSALYVGQDIAAHNGAILTMKFSPDGQLLASAGEDGIIRIWQVTEAPRSQLFQTFDKKSSNVYFTMNALSELVPLNVEKEKRSKLKGLGRSSESACVILPERVFHIADEPIHEFHGHDAEVLDLSWSKEKYLLSASVDKTVRLWKVGSGHCQQVFYHNDYVTCVQFDPVDGNYFISGSVDGKIRIWAVDGCEVVDWIDMKGIVTALCYRPDGEGAIVGSMAGDCFFFDTSDNRLRLVDQMSLQGKKKSPLKRVTGFQFSPVDPTKLMVTSADSHVRILQGSDVIGKYRGFRNGGSQISASFTADGTHIVCASEDSNIYMWDYKAPDRPVPSNVKSTWSSERFVSTNASVAVPWNRKLSGSSVFSSPTAPSGIVVKYTAETETPPAPSSESCNRFPLFSQDALSLGFSETPFSRGTATWPEEKLTDPASLVVSSTACKSDYKFVKATCQGMSGSHHAWGSVIVTAGWDGRIRVFENYGLPVHV